MLEEIINQSKELSNSLERQAEIWDEIILALAEFQNKLIVCQEEIERLHKK